MRKLAMTVVSRAAAVPRGGCGCVWRAPANKRLLPPNDVGWQLLLVAATVVLALAATPAA